jgi:hypothetical protein
MIHPSLTVSKRKDLSCFVKCRQFVRLDGISPPLDIRPFNNCIDTLERAVNERVFFVKNREGVFVEPPKPTYERFSKTLSSFRNELVRYLPRTVPLSRQQFVDTFRGRKQVMYQSAYESLLHHSYTHKDAEIKVFVKCEKTDHTSKVDPVPRVISPRSSRYNIEVGRYLRKIENCVFKAIGRVFGHTTVIKGVDSNESAKLLQEKWGMFSNPVAVGLDASRFDQHVSQAALRYEHGVYLDCFPMSKNKKQLAGLLKQQLVNKCRGYTPDGKLKYNTDGGRMSGDMNTSLGNCLIMCSLIHSYLSYKGIVGQLANNGDDCVVFMDAKDVVSFQEGLFEWFEGMGFHMTMEQPVYEFEHIEFCQTKPVLQDGHYVMCRKPHTTLAKDVVLLTPSPTVMQMEAWLDAVGQGGLALTGGLPVFQEFYQCLVRNGRDTGAKFCDNVHMFGWGVRQLIGVNHKRYSHVLPESRASFYYAFGITPDAQIELEKFYRELTIDVSVSVNQLTYKHDLGLMNGLGC